MGRIFSTMFESVCNHLKLPVERMRECLRQTFLTFEFNAIIKKINSFITVNKKIDI